jgi:hypothetical protein
MGILRDLQIREGISVAIEADRHFSQFIEARAAWRRANDSRLGTIIPAGLAFLNAADAIRTSHPEIATQEAIHVLEDCWQPELRQAAQNLISRLALDSGIFKNLLP